MRYWLKYFLVIVAGLLGASVLWVWAAPLTGPVGRNVVFTEVDTIDIGGYIKGNILTLHQQAGDPPTPPAGDWYLYAKSTGVHTRNPTGTVDGPLGPGGGGGSGAGFIIARVATTGNIALSAEQTIDGVLTSGSVVLVKNQTTASENGPYTSGATWQRLGTFDISAEFANGLSVYVMDGTSGTGNKETVWHFAPPVAGFTLGTTAVTFAKTGPGPTGELLINRDTNSGYPQLRTDGRLKHTQIGSFAQHTALSAATPITVTARQMGIEGNGGPVNLTAVPQIVAGANGDEVELIGTHASNTVQLDQGDGVYLCEGLGSVIVGLNRAKPIFRYNTTLTAWEQIGCTGRIVYGATNLATASGVCDTPNGNCLFAYGSTLRGTAAGADIDNMRNAPTAKSNIDRLDGTTYETMAPGFVHSYGPSGKPRKAIYFPASAISTDGTCVAPTEVTLAAAGSPKQFIFTCANSTSSIFYLAVSMVNTGWDAGAVRAVLHAQHATTENVDFSGAFSGQCKGDADVVDTTFGTGVTTTVSMTTANRYERQESSDITPSGSCAANDFLWLKYTRTTSQANSAAIRILGVTVSYLIGSRSGD